MKVCTKCKESKPLSEFNFKIKEKSIHSSHCRNCSRKYVNNHYLENRLYYLKKARKRNIRIKDEVKNYVRSYLSTHPCVDCGEKDILVLEFDHIHSKISSISRLIQGYYSLDTVMSEIRKCEVRCANCHRRRTSMQFGWFKTNLPL